MDDDTDRLAPSVGGRAMGGSAAATARLRLGAAALLIFAAGIAADQLTKSWALSALADGAAIPLLPTVSLRLAFNPGVAFGLGANLGPVVAIAILVILLALTSWISWAIVSGRPRRRVLLLAAVAAGGWGNMYDRVSRAEGLPLSGTVVDFIAVDWFAIFNVGDILTVCGMIAWAATSLFIREKTARK
ncbi:signal peptidase II [uncultured Schumannella sp.]|uniref:signal peptidase II n=1 Tax=uncultured Schumannella sp. TaxID=1195956 RepID=UPI0025FDB9BE|nr:signal peptidase II [uncultured Schumannella sp.]